MSQTESNLFITLAGSMESIWQLKWTRFYKTVTADRQSKQGKRGKLTIISMSILNKEEG